MDADFRTLYAERLTSAEAAVARIPSGTKLAMGLGAGQPPALLAALAARAAAGGVAGLSVYYMLSTGVAGGSIFAPELADRISPVSLFHSGVERGIDARCIAEGRPLVDFVPTPFSQAPRVLCEHIGIDTLLATVAPMDSRGMFSLGTNTDYTLAVARSGARLILEVNPNMPRVGGDCTIHVSQVDALIENEAPLPALARAALCAEDRAIGAIIAGLVDDGCCLQMGIGALPEAVCAALHDHRHLGIHTEMMTSGLAELMRQGTVDNSRKQIHPGRSIFTFALGDKPLYDFMDGNPELEAYPVEHVNDPAVIASNDRMVSINATTQIDLAGACNSEHVNGRQFSGSGGQLDFVRGAYASRGGRSIIACHSTAAGGRISRIAPALSGPVTTPRTDTHIIVTEHGWADLKGKTLRQRAAALIGLAHPDFREELARAAHGLGLGLGLGPGLG